MLKGLASDFTGSADICKPVRDFTKCVALPYLVTGETILFSLQSAKEEFTFTNQAIVLAVGESATTTRKMVTRLEYKDHQISGVKTETAGRVDRDCELKLVAGTEQITIDVAKDEEQEMVIYYKTLIALSRAQSANSRAWSFATTALGHAATSLRLKDAALIKVANEAQQWLHEQYQHLQPRDYQTVIVAALQEARNGRLPAQ